MLHSFMCAGRRGCPRLDGGASGGRSASGIPDERNVMISAPKHCDILVICDRIFIALFAFLDIPPRFMKFVSLSTCSRARRYRPRIVKPAFTAPRLFVCGAAPETSALGKGKAFGRGRSNSIPERKRQLAPKDASCTFASYRKTR